MIGNCLYTCSPVYVELLFAVRNKDMESGVSRGIDFQFVSNVINFDFPHTSDAYVHRVGRSVYFVNSQYK